MPYSVVTAQWTGIPGSPGWTKLKFSGSVTPSSASTLGGRVRTFFNSQASLLPSAAQISFQTLVQVFEAGELVDEVNMDVQPATVAGANSGSYAGASGAVINWLTGAFTGGRRVRGRTFMVPLGSTAFDSGGTLSTAAITQIQTAATTLLAGTPALVFVKLLEPGGTFETPITGATVPDRAAVLRSRRD